MRKSLKLLPIVAGLIVGHGHIFEVRAQLLNLTTDRCQTDDEVSAKEREPFERATLRFVRELSKANYSEAYGQLTAELRRSTTPDQLAAIMQPAGPILKSLGALSVGHAYVLTSSGWKVEHTLFCSAVAHGSTATLEDKVFVLAKPLPRQAHVIVEGQTPNGNLSFALWLIPEAKEWYVQGFHLVPTTIMGKSAKDILALAREQRLRLHMFNAACFFRGQVTSPFEVHTSSLECGRKSRRN